MLMYFASCHDTCTCFIHMKELIELA